VLNNRIFCDNLSSRLVDLESFKSERSGFVLVISYTSTSSIPGITVAGANPELVKYTPPADAEFILYGNCKSIDMIPATPDGKPTPSVITKTALESTNFPMTVVDSGSEIKPILPYVSLNSKSGNNILIEDGLGYDNVIKNYEMGKILGEQLSKNQDTLVIGESIPGGTTTALGVLQALGIDAFNKVSSSMPENPVLLKNKVVKQALARSTLTIEEYKNDPFKAVSNLGDPMMPTVVGITESMLTSGKKVILAGGTQMCCIAAILKNLKVSLKTNVCIGTTSYVHNDRSSDISNLASQVDEELPIYYVDLGLENSKKDGLRAYSQGFVKEGAGAGGMALAAFINNPALSTNEFLRKIENNYHDTIEIPRLLLTGKN
jgi:uncharacterized protein (TIGR00303 family)